MKVSIKGIQEAQRANARWIAGLRPTGAFGRAIQYATIEAERYAMSITHVLSGALRASHRMNVQALHGQIYIDPAAVNPHGQKPSDYGVYEHNRGGTHAFYERTVDEHYRQVGDAAASVLGTVMK
ncbi:MAG: hypothetical protein P4L50_03290 [Anaerolineaceae bacterium]|nr:hypothetical protein [Anaerolineaceae bacterium]